MTTFPGSPRLRRAGLVLLDPASGQVQRVITLQYNPDTLSRTLQVQGAGADPGDRVETLRLKGPPAETIKVEAEMDAADQLEFPNQNPLAVQHGIGHLLAALEAIIYPDSAAVLANDRLAAAGTLEILPVEAPLTLFVWGPARVVPVRITEFTITEEAFDPSLNPIRAKVSLGMRVLTVNDVGLDRLAGAISMANHQRTESLAGLAPSPGLDALGLGRIP